MSATGGEIQVVFLPSMVPALEAWLANRDLHLFRIPIESDDLPTYGVGIGAPKWASDLLASAQRSAEGAPKEKP